MKRLLILLLVFACLFVISCDMIDTSLFEFNAEYFTVEFDSDGGSNVEPIQVQKNFIAKRPHAPTKEGYFLDGWYTEDGDKWDFMENTVSEDLTLYANWVPLCVVKFDSKIGKKPEKQYVGTGRYATEPVVSSSGYAIEGWYTADGAKWDFAKYKITGDITLTANWTKMLEITLDDTVIHIMPGTSIDSLPKLYKPGAYFKGWYISLGNGLFEKVTENTVFEKDTALVSRWEENENVHLITLDAEEGSLHEDYCNFNRETGEKFGYLPDPWAPSGSHFVGWYDDNDVRYSKNSTVLDSITLHAKYRYKTECPANESKEHRYTVWGYNADRATCTEDLYGERYCMDCQEREIQIIEDALGHTYDDNWTYELMKQSRICLECEYVQVVNYKNMKDFVSAVTLEGKSYGEENADCLFNGDMEETSGTTFCGKENSSLTVYIDLESAIAVNCLSLKGTGNLSYTVYVMWEDGEQYIPVGIGYFGDTITRISINASITKIKIVADKSGDGSNFWQELIIAQAPKF